MSLICARTAADGGDATAEFTDSELVGDVFAVPYLLLEPDCAFVVTDDDDRAVGYVVGTPDTADFVARYESDYLPGFRERWGGLDPVGDRETWTLGAGLDPARMLVPAVRDFPAHLHIDLLPEAQGSGAGRALVRTVLRAVRERGAHALHLGVSATNANARGFYARVGFTPVSPDDPTTLGIPTDAPV